jgi:hypothetical protein
MAEEKKTTGITAVAASGEGLFESPNNEKGGFVRAPSFYPKPNRWPIPPDATRHRVWESSRCRGWKVWLWFAATVTVMLTPFSDLIVTEEDLLEAKVIAANLTLEETRDVSVLCLMPFSQAKYWFWVQMMVSVMKIHERDPNFPHGVLLRIHEFLGRMTPILMATT